MSRIARLPSVVISACVEKAHQLETLLDGELRARRLDWEALTSDQGRALDDLFALRLVVEQATQTAGPDGSAPPLARAFGPASPGQPGNNSGGADLAPLTSPLQLSPGCPLHQAEDARGQAS